MTLDKYYKLHYFVFNKLYSELPHFRKYHSPEHTLDVLDSLHRIAGAEGINAESDILRLSTAGLLHDCGFLVSNNDHEENSCELAEKWLPDYDYGSEDIDIIKSCIMATKIPQNPTHILEEILCDADLDHLGRSDFEEVGSKLRYELEYFGIINSANQWYSLQENFLTQHQYWTSTSIKWRDPAKQAHLKEIQVYLRQQ